MFIKSNKAKNLEHEIKKANDAYYNSDTPIMSDQEYDLKLFSGIYNHKNNARIINKTPLTIIGSLTEKLAITVLSTIPINAPICPACAPFI